MKDFRKGIRQRLKREEAIFRGGQKQRIAIARALLRESDIVLMDEPTSSLDPKSENEIVKLVDNVLGDKTIITIAHKLNTVRDYDRIYVLDKGNIIEKGSHDELIEKGGAYYRLYTGLDNEEMQ